MIITSLFITLRRLVTTYITWTSFGPKGSTKANLQKQLKDLDPEGVIQRFLEQGGERPGTRLLLSVGFVCFCC